MIFPCIHIGDVAGFLASLCACIGLWGGGAIRGLTQAIGLWQAWQHVKLLVNICLTLKGLLITVFCICSLICDRQRSVFVTNLDQENLH